MDRSIERGILEAEVAALLASLLRSGINFPPQEDLSKLSDLELSAVRDRIDHLIRTIPQGRR